MRSAALTPSCAHAVFKKLMPPEYTAEKLLAKSREKDQLFCELYREQAEQQGPPMLDGLPAALALAKQHDIRCVAVTNAPRGAAETTIASLRATIPEASVIEDLVIGAECTRAKPHPDPYIEGARRLGVPVESCLVFEDSRSGIKSGVAAGCPVIGMRSSLSDEELCKAGCAVSLADWTELTMDLLEQLSPIPPEE